MATDATGTPTPLGVPKYNTSADAPSGLGFNAAMDSIDTLIAARIAKSLVTTTGDIIYASGASTPARLPIGSSGQALVVSGGLPAWGSAGGPGAPATTLPGSPSDGQQALLVDSTAAPTYAWLFQWSTTASKWIFIGGSAAFAEVTTSEATASGTYVALATAGPSFTVPRAGVYEIAIGFETGFVTSAEQMFMSYDIGGTGAVDADASIAASGVNATAPNIVGMRARQKTIAAPATALVAKYKVGNAVSESFGKRWLRVTPVTVT